MPTETIIYRIDRDDRIVSVNAAWDAFASANAGHAVAGDRVVGRGLFEFIGDATTRALYRQMLARIRGGRDMRFTFRCDSPECRRLMEMQVRRADDSGGVEFRSEALEERPRPPVWVSQADGATDPDDRVPLRVCGWCNRVDVAGAWLELEEAMPRLGILEEAAPPDLTHGICEACFEKMAAELEFVVDGA